MNPQEQTNPTDPTNPMNPVNPATPPAAPVNPAEQQDGTQKFFAAIENARPDQLDTETTTKGDVQMNVINAVNANGIVSGRKVVDFIWQRMAICAMIIAAGCAIAVIVMVIIANAYNIDTIKTRGEKNTAENHLSEIYGLLGASNHSEAVVELAKSEILSGDDLSRVSSLIAAKYGADAKIDTAGGSENFIVSSGVYRIVSLKLVGVEERVFLYMRKADNTWSLAAYDSRDTENPCKDSSEEEKKALSAIVTCPEVKEEEGK